MAIGLSDYLNQQFYDHQNDMYRQQLAYNKLQAYKDSDCEAKSNQQSVTIASKQDPMLNHDLLLLEEV